MEDLVYVRFRQSPPFSVRLKGDWWRVSIGYTRAKSTRYANLSASREQSPIGYVLAHGMAGQILSAAVDEGFAVKRGSPEHGLVSAMYRAGVADLYAVRPRTRLERFTEKLELTRSTRPDPAAATDRPRPVGMIPRSEGIRFTTSDLCPDETLI